MLSDGFRSETAKATWESLQPESRLFHAPRVKGRAVPFCTGIVLSVTDSFLTPILWTFYLLDSQRLREPLLTSIAVSSAEKHTLNAFAFNSTGDLFSSSEPFKMIRSYDGPVAANELFKAI